MFKVFNRKNSKAQHPSSTITIGSPAPLGTQHHRTPSTKQEVNPPPLYARFATRGESIDSSNASLSIPSTPHTVPSSEDLRAEYTKVVVNKESRFYGNESVTRFGSGPRLAGVSSSKTSKQDVKNVFNGGEQKIFWACSRPGWNLFNFAR